jgi:hypothetical protein
MSSAAEKDREEQRERYRELLEEVRTIMPRTQVLLALAVGGAIFVVVRFVFDDTVVGAVVGGVAVVAAALLWYVVPALEPQSTRVAAQPYIKEPGVVSCSPVSSHVLRPDRIIGQPPKS